mmetsp:Transcript_15172/g.32278  ORF Transcript_15172/g.32278 Transcript_15172/m.32278 type:complete len:213 (+) Transcript_15172:1857-2495(+)
MRHRILGCYRRNLGHRRECLHLELLEAVVLVEKVALQHQRRAALAALAPLQLTLPIVAHSSLAQRGVGAAERRLREAGERVGLAHLHGPLLSDKPARPRGLERAAAVARGGAAVARAWAPARLHAALRKHAVWRWRARSNHVGRAAVGHWRMPPRHRQDALHALELAFAVAALVRARLRMQWIVGRAYSHLRSLRMKRRGLILVWLHGQIRT